MKGPRCIYMDVLTRDKETLKINNHSYKNIYEDILKHIHKILKRSYLSLNLRLSFF